MLPQQLIAELGVPFSRLVNEVAMQPIAGVVTDAPLVLTSDSTIPILRLPRIDADHSTYTSVLGMLDGWMKGFFVLGENPAVGSANGRLHRLAMANLDWLVVKDLHEIETASFWYDSPEVEIQEGQRYEVQLRGDEPQLGPDDALVTIIEFADYQCPYCAKAAGPLKAIVKKSGGKPTPYQVDLMRHQQWTHVNDILERPLEQSYQAQVIEGFDWESWIDPARKVTATHERTDTRLKNYPYRSQPIEAPQR